MGDNNVLSNQKTFTILGIDTFCESLFVHTSSTSPTVQVVNQLLNWYYSPLSGGLARSDIDFFFVSYPRQHFS